MALHNILHQNRNKGFTLVEILVVIFLLLIIFSLGLFIAFDFYKSYAFHSERNIIVSALQKARNHSLNNINQVRHGVRFERDPYRYVIFECPSSDPQCDSYTASPADIIIDSSYGISITDPVALPFIVIFEQLSGNCVTPNCSTSPLIITIQEGAKENDIEINSEGRIDWN